ncbi:transporter substrate-binding domain-containing protein [Nonomuraea sp. NPDC046570]|uniref:transporter substrate-binding domain-containing protein n=1 Tax=Nonomuraea sp. NPDC046570 TaxID=3155255 RepID=UPI0033F8A6BB
MKRHLWPVALVFCLLLAACQGGVRPTPTAGAPSPFLPPKGKGIVHVGVVSDHPGWSTLEVGSEQRNGFDIALITWLKSGLKIHHEYTGLSLGERESALVGKRVQMVVATFSMTDLRKKRIDFAGPYMVTYQGAMVRAGDDRIKTENDLVAGGRHVCVVERTTSYDALLPHRGPKLRLTVVSAQKQCVERLLAGQVDAMSTDQLVLYGFAEADKRLRVIPDLTFGFAEQYGIGLPDNDRADCEILREKLQEFLDTSTWDLFFRQHFRNVPPDLIDKHKPRQVDPCD